MHRRDLLKMYLHILTSYIKAIILNLIISIFIILTLWIQQHFSGSKKLSRITSIVIWNCLRKLKNGSKTNNHFH